MKTRYDVYYRSIPNLGGKGNSSASKDRPARPARRTPEPVVRQRSVLEAMHPEIVQAITLLWGYPEMNTYFEKLWLSDGSAMPIAPEAMSELMLLAGVHRWLAPERPARNLASIYDASVAPPRRKDIWEETPRRR